MNKFRVASTLFIGLLIINTISVSSVSENQLFKTPTISTDKCTCRLYDGKYGIENITLQDDAYHKTNKLIRPEWWYFDASFDKGYSVHIGYMIVVNGKHGIVSPGLNIYKDSELVFHKRIFLPTKYFDFSETEPSIKMYGNQVVEGYIDQETGEWKYNVSIAFDKYSVNLQFTGTAKGWKTVLSSSKWTVVLPRADVTGTITLDGETTQVDGSGYHDHNWDVHMARYELGYLWGKLQTDYFNMIFTKYQTLSGNDSFSVLNVGTKDFLLIKPDTISFDILEYETYRGLKLINKSRLVIEDDMLNLNVTIETINVFNYEIFRHFYRRYFVRITGTLSYDGTTEIIDTTDLLEETKFR